MKTLFLAFMTNITPFCLRVKGFFDKKIESREGEVKCYLSILLP